MLIAERADSSTVGPRSACSWVNRKLSPRGRGYTESCAVSPPPPVKLESPETLAAGPGRGLVASPQNLVTNNNLKNFNLK